MNATDKTTAQIPAWLTLPKELEGASTKTLAERYFHLAEIKLAGETRVGRHPSEFNKPDDLEPDPFVREVLDAGLHTTVREMAAIQYALNQRPDGFMVLITGEVPDDKDA